MALVQISWRTKFASQNIGLACAPNNQFRKIKNPNTQPDKIMKIKQFKSNSSVMRIRLTPRLRALGVGLCFSLASLAGAQTIISGPDVSGTWSPSGNPYIVSGNVTVPSGQSLTIQPGVVVWIGSGVTITNNGLIKAVGTPTERIEFQAPVSSQYWNTIYLFNAPSTNQFHYCDFANAQTGISMLEYNGNSASTEIFNCTFSNCVSQAIYGQAQGYLYCFECPPYNCCGGGGNATLYPVIKNCVFLDSSNGCVMNALGGTGQCGCTGYGYVVPQLIGNIFQNLSGTAFLMTTGTYAGGSQPLFVNNTLINCQTGVSAIDPWNAVVENNLFVGCTNAVIDPGTLSRQVQFNDFYGNATNFTGYDFTYGQWIIPNRNGSLADILYNISQNPLFIATNDFHLQSTSPCVNAGEPGNEFANLCTPPAVGTNYNDMGAYGGPDACNWLTNVPELPAQLSITRSNSLLLLNFGAIPRSTYEVQYIATNFNASAGTNKWLTNTTVVPAVEPISLPISPYPPTNKNAFYRVQSLGRTPGN